MLAMRNPSLQEILISDDVSSFAIILERDYSDYLEGELYEFLRHNMMSFDYSIMRNSFLKYRRNSKEGITFLLRIFTDILDYYPDSVRIAEFLLDLLRGEYDTDYLLLLILSKKSNNKVLLIVYLAEYSQISYKILVKYTSVSMLKQIIKALAANFDKLRFYKEFPTDDRFLEKLKLVDKITLDEFYTIFRNNPLEKLLKFYPNIDWNSSPGSYLWIINQICKSEFSISNLILLLEIVKKYSVNEEYFEEAEWFWEYLYSITEVADNYSLDDLEKIDELLVLIAENIGRIPELNPEVFTFFPELKYYLENRS